MSEEMKTDAVLTAEEENAEPQTADTDAAPAENTAAAQSERDAPQEKPKDAAATESREDEKDEQKKEKRRFRKPSKEEEKIAALEKENAELNDRFLRICAEYDNFRRRSQKEKEGLYGEIKADTVTKFLPVYDNLERALKQGTEDEAYRKGVEMIMTQFTSTLEKLGVTPIECLGEKFDPTLHNAVMHVDDGEKGENEIVEVFQKGFRLGDKVVRFAMVKVAN